MLLGHTTLTSATAGARALCSLEFKIVSVGPWKTGTRTHLPLPPEAALTNARLGRDPGQPQVQDHAPDIEHAPDLGGEWGGSEATWVGGTPQGQTRKSLSPVTEWHREPRPRGHLSPFFALPTLVPLWSCGAGREGNPETHLPLPPIFLPSC